MWTIKGLPAIFKKAKSIAMVEETITQIIKT